MIWIKGIAGFLLGFSIGMLAMAYGLRKVPQQRLASDSTLRMTGSAFVWGCAVFAAWLATRF